MKDSQRLFTSVSSLNRQIREVEERLILRRHVTKLHGVFLRDHLREKLASPSVLVTAAGIGMGVGALLFARTEKPEPETAGADKASSGDGASRPSATSILATALNAWPFIELALSLIPGKDPGNHPAPDADTPNPAAVDESASVSP